MAELLRVFALRVTVEGQTWYVHDTGDRISGDGTSVPRTASRFGHEEAERTAKTLRTFLPKGSTAELVEFDPADYFPRD